MTLPSPLDEELLLPMASHQTNIGVTFISDSPELGPVPRGSRLAKPVVQDTLYGDPRLSLSGDFVVLRV